MTEDDAAVIVLCGHPLAESRHMCQRPRGHEGIHYPRPPAKTAARDGPSDPHIELGQNWIETTSYRERSATNWLVKCGSEIVQTGQVRDDPTGNRAFEAARKP